MRRIIALLLAVALFAGCSRPINSEETNVQNNDYVVQEITPVFGGLDDTSLTPYLEDSLYINLVRELDDENYFVENVSAKYVSKEYLEEVAYNSQENIYFGYTLSELDETFEGNRYVFTLGEDGQTVITEFEKYDDTYEQVLKNVVVGTGVILICVTVSAVTAGTGASAVSMIFAVSAKEAAAMAASGAVLGGVSAGVVKGIETGDFDEAIKAAALAGSEAFKWGAISGAVKGGAKEAIALKGATANGLTMNEAARIQRESKFPIDVIKQFSNMEQYQICKDAGLTPQMINGKLALIREIDLDIIDEAGRTNFQRMSLGLAALDSTGKAYDLHHIGQKVDSTLAILTKAEHMKGGNNQIWHVLGETSEVHAAGNNWDIQRQKFWMELASILAGNA